MFALADRFGERDPYALLDLPADVLTDWARYYEWREGAGERAAEPGWVTGDAAIFHTLRQRYPEK